MSFPDDYRIKQLIEDVEQALHYGERVSVATKEDPNITGYVTSATDKSFKVEHDDGRKWRVRIADGLLFDSPDL